MIFVKTAFSHVPLGVPFVFEGKTLKRVVPEVLEGETLNAMGATGECWFLEDNDTVQIMEKMLNEAKPIA